MAENSDVYFIDGMRTPFGRAGEKGQYWNTRADDLVVKTIIGVMGRNPDVPADRIDDVAIAATSQTGDQGLTLGRSAAILAGLPQSVPGFAIDRMCAGAMTSVTTMAGSIGFGMYDLALAGGVEHMGRHPIGANSDPNPRFVAERLVDPGALNMGVTAERIFDRFPHLTKERSDRYGMLSQHKAQAAYDAGKIQPDLVSVATKDAEGAWGIATEDEGRRPQTTMADLAGLKTPFRPHGRVTAGTSSPLTDGATMSLLAGGHAVRELGLRPKMKLVSFAFAGVQPEIMGIGPIPSTEKALAKAGLSITDIGLFELNEAFAIQVISLLDHFGIADDDPRVNQWGGAIALGHPLAASGVRLMIQLAAQFAERPDVRYGLTAMCVGLGQGGSVIWENPYYDGKKK
ncbi:MAG: acetyl-CoA C-acyltransferase [Microbacterium sp.]|uniref:acetyl-CoA C-acyltransferase n=2 Tax=Microbacterium TaxID=33882 RepID=A0A0F0LRE0_9MICO|nr:MULTISPECIES: thiolase family protein [Microbacterium]MAL07294.1 acetyl-CoA C-acyltransferase [Microbacterium sp.]MCK9916450.1 thiolase family protein [Microbacteriaceae bacterium K1510]KJL35698.1 3-ketoacyl-CoA thiolase [Microbacterium ginsengisoli]KQS05527.1 acetyl-CoA acetyltransferase [Microbacterium sp. Leaf347]MBN9197392.1 thiolase family protein [Microbacterium ginsengisoli]